MLEMAMEPVDKVGFAKGSFGLKMSKKVAELTQVVHMLFTRNHEREVELDEMRDAYEQEISAVIQDAKMRIEKLEYQVRDVERKRKKEADDVNANVSRVLRESQERVESLKNDLTEERRDSKHLRDLLTQAHKDLEILKHGSTGISGDLVKKNKILEDRERDYQKLAKNYNELEAKFAALNKHAEHIKYQLDITSEALRRSKLLAEKSAKVLDEKNRLYHELMRKNKNCEEEIKSLKREINLKKKLGNFDGDQNPSGRSSQADLRPDQKISTDYERIKKENEWLRNELRNREGNFNRVFAAFQPVCLGGHISTKLSGDFRDRDMMMIMPTSSYSQPSLTSKTLPPSSNFPEVLSARRPSPNLTGLDAKFRSTTSTPVATRPKTKQNGRVHNNDMNDPLKSGKNFRIVFTK